MPICLCYCYSVRIIYSGGETKERGVAIALAGRARDAVDEVECISDRIIRIRLRSSPVDMEIVQVYMPTSDHADEEVNLVYEQIEEMIAKCKGKCQLILGDWNSQVGEGREGKIVGQFGLGRRNARGERLIEFCRQNQLVVANTWFQHHARRRYTWTMPGGRNRFQLDYITASSGVLYGRTMSLNVSGTRVSGTNTSTGRSSLQDYFITSSKYFVRQVCA